jgi:predicted nuclease with TOPRIM domain
MKIKDHENLVRDEASNAVLNADLSSLQAYRERRAKSLQMVQDVENLKSDVSEIKNLLLQLIEKNDK